MTCKPYHKIFLIILLFSLSKASYSGFWSYLFDFEDIGKSAISGARVELEFEKTKKALTGVGESVVSGLRGELKSEESIEALRSAGKSLLDGGVELLRDEESKKVVTELASEVFTKGGAKLQESTATGISDGGIKIIEHAKQVFEENKKDLEDLAKESIDHAYWSAQKIILTIFGLYIFAKVIAKTANDFIAQITDYFYAKNNQLSKNKKLMVSNALLRWCKQFLVDIQSDYIDDMSVDKIQVFNNNDFVLNRQIVKYFTGSNDLHFMLLKAESLAKKSESYLERLTLSIDKPTVILLEDKESLIDELLISFIDEMKEFNTNIKAIFISNSQHSSVQNSFDFGEIATILSVPKLPVFIMKDYLNKEFKKIIILDGKTPYSTSLRKIILDKQKNIVSQCKSLENIKVFLNQFRQKVKILPKKQRKAESFSNLLNSMLVSA